MMLYMGELWNIDYYLPPGQAGRFDNIRGDGPEMGGFKISKRILIPLTAKCKFRRPWFPTKRTPLQLGPEMIWFRQVHWVWEDNPLQPYELVAPW